VVVRRVGEAGDRLEDGVRPVAQRVEIAVDPAKPETTGRTVITGTRATSAGSTTTSERCTLAP
jgi:hypothetical protein